MRKREVNIEIAKYTHRSRNWRCVIVLAANHSIVLAASDNEFPSALHAELWAMHRCHEQEWTCTDRRYFIGSEELFARP